MIILPFVVTLFANIQVKHYNSEPHITHAFKLPCPRSQGNCCCLAINSWMHNCVCVLFIFILVCICKFKSIFVCMCMFVYMCISCIFDEYVICLSTHNAHCHYSAWFVLLGFVLHLYFLVFVFVACVDRTLAAPGCCSGLRASLRLELEKALELCASPPPVLVPFSFLIFFVCVCVPSHPCVVSLFLF